MKTYILTISLFFTLTIAYSQSYKVIVNSDNSTASLTSKEVSDIFLKRTSRWDSGVAILPVDLTPNSSVRATFTQEVHGRNVNAIRSFWQQAAFSGAGSPPPEQPNDEAVVNYVRNNPGAIGYVSAAASTVGVKTITVR
ncbi:substrate-binding domain-containing protein [Alkalitalea saponilacus]|uniref:PBP superfamily domain-containing protein n=1 Tax=Alkalitalea saponilacus TaxID=889453 RepID=A0A1T5HT55_9BACT|nr:substrate-binding domain-containing protein [Alkalitalea saponilacus]ASB48973.1 hypothetical protein CDL62_07405 [Alkalitalea saponilacus]SKC23879.1 PBP superfamily domain-containing protein [Alkalitalea saponilacus]